MRCPCGTLLVRQYRRVGYCAPCTARLTALLPAPPAPLAASVSYDDEALSFFNDHLANDRSIAEHEAAGLVAVSFDLTYPAAHPSLASLDLSDLDAWPDAVSEDSEPCLTLSFRFESDETGEEVYHSEHALFLPPVTSSFSALHLTALVDDGWDYEEALALLEEDLLPFRHVTPSGTPSSPAAQRVAALVPSPAYSLYLSPDAYRAVLAELSTLGATSVYLIPPTLSCDFFVSLGGPMTYDFLAPPHLSPAEAELYLRFRADGLPPEDATLAARLV